MSAIRLSEYLAQPWRQVGWVCGVASDATPDSVVVRLANFLTPHFLGDVAVVVCSVVCSWGFWRWGWRQTGKTVAGTAPTACAACRRRSEGQKVACGVVLGCGFCAVVGVYMA